ncbi:MAG: hypothetical protein IAE63_06780 [Alphaproteobacteria bacterium]|nr:hypothetical protein [Alphaproteobacteria bacterium]
MTALAAMLPTIGASTAATTAGSAALSASSAAAITAGVGNTAMAAGINAMMPMAMAAPTFSLGSLFSGGMTLASAGLSLFGASSQSQGILAQSRAEARTLEGQAKDQELAAKQEGLRGQQEANDILENLNKTLASQRLAFSASGFDPMSGTAQAVAKNTVKSADVSLGISRSDAILRSLNRRRQAQELIISRGNVLNRASGDARSTFLSGIGSAATSLTDLGMRRIARG